MSHTDAQYNFQEIAPPVEQQNLFLRQIVTFYVNPESILLAKPILKLTVREIM